MRHRLRIGILTFALAAVILNPRPAALFAQTGTASPAPVTLGNLAVFYFDYLDLMRSQTLGREFVTPPAERQRISGLVGSYWQTLDQGTQATLIAIAERGRSARAEYAAMTDAAKVAARAEWKKIVLSPLWIYPPLPAAHSYSNSGFSLSYPASWQYAEGSGVLFMGPDIQTTWEAVNDASASPPGMLMAAFNNDTNGAPYLEVARTAAKAYVPGLQELCAFGSDAGAIVCLNGSFPGQREEKFFWVVLIPAGDLLILARMGGSVREADALVPSFYAIVNSMNYKPPYSPGPITMAFETAWSKVSSAIVADIWAK